MEELKLLIEMVASLPQMALWVCIGFFVYKVTVIGSIYGVIRFCVQKAYDAYKKPQEFTLNGITINKDVETALKVQLARLTNSAYGYIHSTDVADLQRAIEYILKERKK